MVERIVVVGGGAAGLELVTALGQRYGKPGKAEITLVDAARTHLWKPLLHSVAAGSLDANAEALNYLAHAHANHYRFRLGEMVGLDRAAKVVKLAASYDDEGRLVTPEQAVPYDTLVLAIGSVTNDFGTEGAAQYAVPLETPEQAARFNRRVINACIRAQAQDEAVRPGQLHVAVIGAGATGTELAAELHHTVRQIVATGLDRIKPEEDIRIVLIEASDRILPALSERISEATLTLLQRLRVDVRTGARVTKVGPDGVTLQSGDFVPAELVVWAAGVKGPDVLADLGGLESTRSQMLEVLPSLQTTRDADVFAMGDCAACPLPDGGLVPPRAQAAHQQASHMLKQVARRMRGEALLPFVYRDFGSLVSLGHAGAVGNLMGLVGRGFFIDGLVARLMYRSLHKMHQQAVHGSLRMVADTLAHAVSKRRDRQVKLH